MALFLGQAGDREGKEDMNTESSFSSCRKDKTLWSVIPSVGHMREGS